MADKEPTPTPSRTDVPPLLIPPVAPPPPESDLPPTDEVSEEKERSQPAEDTPPPVPSCTRCDRVLELHHITPNPATNVIGICPHCGTRYKV